MLDVYKELTPVVYGENAIKYLCTRAEGALGRMCFPMHWHDRMELLYVSRGTVKIHSEGKRIEVGERQIAAIAPRQMHCGFTASESVVYHTIIFVVEKFCNASGASDKYLRPLLKEEIRFDKAADDASLQRATEGLEIIGLLYPYCISEGRVIRQQDESFGPILEYVNAHFAEKLSLESISRMFGYNQSYFCRRFRKITGIPFSRYLQLLRMECAQKLLQNTGEGIASVAMQCGFADVGYFSNCFKKSFGFTPAQFRKMMVG